MKENQSEDIELQDIALEVKDAQIIIKEDIEYSLLSSKIEINDFISSEE